LFGLGLTTLLACGAVATKPFGDDGGPWGGTGGSGGAGGSSSTGGASTGGASTGGTAAGGKGGGAATGGATNTGGTAVGGKGGIPGTGGNPTGGAGAKGGQGGTPSGGNSGTGGIASTGGSPATGGMSTGGTSTGGAATGGSATGGAATGGTGMGGAGGTGMRSCSEIEAAYKAAIPAAQSCTATSTCALTVPNTLGCNPCNIPVQNAKTLNALSDEWSAQGCSRGVICPLALIACVYPLKPVGYCDTISVALPAAAAPIAVARGTCEWQSGVLTATTN